MTFQTIINTFLDKKTKIFSNNGFLYFVNNKDIYKIEPNEKIIAIFDETNNKIIKFQPPKAEFEEILMSLMFILKGKYKYTYPTSNYINIKNLYVSSNFNEKINSYLDSLENEIKVRNSREINKYKKSVISGKFHKYHDIDLSIFEKSSEIKENVKKKKVNILLKQKEFVDLCLIILKSDNIIFDTNILSIHYLKDLLIYNFSNIKSINFNNKKIELSKKQIGYILTCLYYKDENLLLKKTFLSNKKYYNQLPKLNKLSEELSIYNREKCKIKIINKKREEKKKIKKELLGNINSFSNNKNANVKKEDIFKSESLSTLGELIWQKEHKVEDKYEETDNFTPYFKKKLLNKKDNTKKDEEIKSLVLWDLENINYYNDFSTITRFVKNDNQLKVMSFSNKYRDYKNTNSFNFTLEKLKKRFWIINETKKIADNVLIENFHKYKHYLKELIVISNDSDFKDIISEANHLGINTIVLYRHGNKNKNYWYDIAKEKISLQDIQ